MNISEYNQIIKKSSRSKYRSIKTVYNGVSYMSKKESEFAKLLDLQKKDKNNPVINWQGQVPFQIIINNIKVFKYLLDFKVEYENGDIEYIDVKGFKGGMAYSMFKLKKKCVEAQYNIKIKEV